MEGIWTRLSFSFSISILKGFAIARILAFSRLNEIS